MDKRRILELAMQLIRMYRDGLLGGEVMPEDANPQLAKDTRENYLYFTLPMALNYQRSAYALWNSALQTYTDPQTQFLFSPQECLSRSFAEVQQALTQYKLALQRQKQTEIWLRLCRTFAEQFDGDVRLFFAAHQNDIRQIKRDMQITRKKEFPYLSGTKICNYWLYVIHRYTDRQFTGLDALTVAPDTHVCQASRRLGLITEEEFRSPHVQAITAAAWEQLLAGSPYTPIDMHTPLWLWSRNGFPEIKAGESTGVEKNTSCDPAERLTFPDKYPII